MSDRISRKDVEEAFAYFVRSIGGKVAESHADGGAYLIERGPGGYIVYQIIPGSSGVREPFGARRRPAAEMHRTLIFAADAAHIAKGER